MSNRIIEANNEPMVRVSRITVEDLAALECGYARNLEAINRDLESLNKKRAGNEALGKMIDKLRKNAL